MLQEAITHTLDTLPVPSRSDEYVTLDDYKLWSMMQNDDTNEWFENLVNRNHIRKVFKSTDESEQRKLDRIKSTDESEQRKLDRIIEKLDEEHIWYWRDDLETNWYEQEMDKEVMLIDKDGELNLLSNRSKIIEDLEPFNVNRLYVKPSDRGKVNKIKKDVVK